MAKCDICGVESDSLTEVKNRFDSRITMRVCEECLANPDNGLEMVRRTVVATVGLEAPNLKVKQTVGQVSLSFCDTGVVIEIKPDIEKEFCAWASVELREWQYLTEGSD